MNVDEKINNELSTNQLNAPYASKVHAQRAPSISLIRIIGYVLLSLALIDLCSILFPPSFKDASWEFQTLGEIVQRSPVPLMGFLFVFYADNQLRQKWEILIVKFLSWLTLALAMLSLLFMGLGLSATLRLNNQYTLQVDGARGSSLNQLQKTQEQIKNASDDQISQLLARSERSGGLKTIQSPDEFRKRFNDEFDKAQETLRQRSEIALSTQKKSLLKNSVKWNFSAIISAVAYFYLWKGSVWARGKKRKRKKRK